MVFNKTSQTPDNPLPTLTAKNGHAVAAATLINIGYGEKPGQLVKMRGTNIGQSVEEPLQTISAQGKHFAEVRALLVKYYGNEKDGQPLNEPLDTVPTKDRFALITVYIGSEPYVIVDIGLRMLQPHELYAAQGFPADYIFDRQADGTPITKTAQVQKCGNAVCPPVARAIVAVNLNERFLLENAV